MQQFCQYGSVRGATGNRRPYRDDDFPGSLPQVAVRSPKQKAPRGAGPEAASRPAEQV